MKDPVMDKIDKVFSEELIKDNTSIITKSVRFFIKIRDKALAFIAK